MKIQQSIICSDYKLVTYNDGREFVVYYSASFDVKKSREGRMLKSRFFPEQTESGGVVKYTALPNRSHLSEGEDEVYVSHQSWVRENVRFYVKKIFENGNVTLRSVSTNETLKLTDKNEHEFSLVAPRWQSLETRVPSGGLLE